MVVSYVRLLNTLTACLRITLLFLAVGFSHVHAQITVAFVGDQGTSASARAVLQLVEREGADLLLIQGDLGYGAKSAQQWIENIDRGLGPDFPVLLTVGNHENYEWPLYQRWMMKRIKDVPELVCDGNPGVKAHCTFRGISVVQVAQGVDEVDGVDDDDKYPRYLEKELSGSPNAWRICSWHKNQKSMQVGGKSDETGWGVYNACLKHGGIVATAHEHSYARTHLMSDFEDKKIVHTRNTLEIGPGRSFAFVSGLGGINIRKQRRSGPWWASVYTAHQNATFGALFCTIDEMKASCRFKAINGVVPDEFELVNRNTPSEQPVISEVTKESDDKKEIRKGSVASMSNVVVGLFMCYLLAFRRSRTQLV